MSNPFNPKSISPMAHDFAKVPRIGVNRSAFKATQRRIAMFDAGKLIPVFKPYEVIPGSTIKFDISFLCRLNTPIVPVMDNLKVIMHHWFIPMRKLWSNAEKFWGAKDNPGDSTTYTIPVVTGHADGWTVESLGDYFGIPIDKTKNVNALQFRAYNYLYNECYKDQNIINNATVNVDNGPDSSASYTIRRRGKRADYFTTCLPAPQQGSAASFSLTGTATVVKNPTSGAIATPQILVSSTGAPLDTLVGLASDADSDFCTSGSNIPTSIDPNGQLAADLSGVSGLTIAEFRETIQLQALAEIENRGGHRYTEILYSVFNTVSPDFRLQRPEYLGGSTTPIYIVPVAQTSATAGSEPQGQLAAYGSAFGTNNGFTKSFTEHGYILSIMCVDADQTYSQGLHRDWTRSTKYDFFNPLLQNIGDQAVLRQEIYLADNDSSSDNTVFGYQERYAEYMYLQSDIVGKLRPAYSAPYDYWHLSEEFGSAPTLSQTFIESNPPIDRIVTVTTEPDFVIDIWNEAMLVLPMSLHSVPGYLGRM